MTDEQLEKQISEEFEKWYFKDMPKVEDPNLFKALASSNPEYSKRKELFRGIALPLMKKIEEIQKDKDQLHTSYQKCIVSLENKEIENEKLQKENEELREALEWATKKIETLGDIRANDLAKDLKEILTKFNLDKNDKVAV